MSSFPLEEVTSGHRIHPVDPVSTSVQESQFIENNRVLRNEHQFTYTNINGSGHQGCSALVRHKLAFESGILEDIRFVLNNLVIQSNQNPAKISLKGDYAFLPNYLIDYLQSNSSIDTKIDCLLIIRNSIQNIDNCQIISTNNELRKCLINFLDLYINDSQLGFFEKEQIQEMVKFSLDIIENISSYLSPVKEDDLIFNKLIEIFKLNENKYISITILRSISRYLYNSSSTTNDASGLIDDEFLNKTVGFLLLSTNGYDIDDEIILTSLDFLIQYLSIKEENMNILVGDFNRQLLLEKLIPKLLTHKQNYKTEFDQQSVIRLYKRISDQLNKIIPNINTNSTLFKQLNQLSEPHRAHAWMRCCFKPNKDSYITQIELWRAYEKCFDKASQLAAVIFIKNVQAAFPLSSAKVLMEGEEKKFVIQGLEPRIEPVTIEIGKQDALKGRLINDENLKSDLNQSEQVKVDLFNYGFNDYLKLNEINQSTVTLIKQMMEYSSGEQLLKGHQNELLEASIYVPDLMATIYEVIESMSM